MWCICGVPRLLVRPQWIALYMVRIVQGSEVRLYLQPTMSTPHRTETVEVIDGARLKVRGEGASRSRVRAGFLLE